MIRCHNELELNCLLIDIDGRDDVFVSKPKKANSTRWPLSRRYSKMQGTGTLYKDCVTEYSRGKQAADCQNVTIATTIVATGQNSQLLPYLSEDVVDPVRPSLSQSSPHNRISETWLERH